MSKDIGIYWWQVYVFGDMIFKSVCIQISYYSRHISFLTFYEAAPKLGFLLPVVGC